MRYIADSTPESRTLPHVPAQDLAVRRYQQAVYARLLHFTMRHPGIAPEIITSAERMCPDLTGLNAFLVYAIVNASADSIYRKDSRRRRECLAVDEGAEFDASPLMLGRCRLFQRLVRRCIMLDMHAAQSSPPGGVPVAKSITVQLHGDCDNIIGPAGKTRLTPDLTARLAAIGITDPRRMVWVNPEPGNPATYELQSVDGVFLPESFGDRRGRAIQ